MFHPSPMLERAQVSRDRAIAWMVDHIGSDGTPADAGTRTSWSRLGWSLAVAGEQGAAGAVVDWAVRHRLTPEGDYLPGFMAGQSYISNHSSYWLGTFVISAWMAGRCDVAMRSMDVLRSRQDAATGGLFLRSDAGNYPGGVTDLLSTAQVGLSALVTGQMDVADRVFDWLHGLMALQPKGLQFHMYRKGEGVWTAPDPAFAWTARVHFDQPRQAYYGPGMAAVFLAPYATMRGRPEAMELARLYLRYNVEGTDAQFSDTESVQACKFGWAVGAMHQADPASGWAPWVPRMAQWFMDRQAPEGWWGPSRFADADPSYADRLVKTSEHAMELSVLIAAMGAEQARQN